MIPFNVLEYYYKWGYSVIRKHTASAFVIMCQRIGGDFAEFVNTLPADNVVLDVHFYNLFNPDLFGKTTAQWNIDFINNDRFSLLQQLNRAGNALILIGEFAFANILNLLSIDLAIDSIVLICIVCSKASLL